MEQENGIPLLKFQHLNLFQKLFLIHQPWVRLFQIPLTFLSFTSAPKIILWSFKGQEAVVVKNGSRLCGTGAARATTPILQNKAYWEFKLQQAGVWSCGLSNPGCDLNKNLGNDLNSWALTHENVIKVNGNIEQKLEQKIQEGDIIVSICKVLIFTRVF